MSTNFFPVISTDETILFCNLNFHKEHAPRSFLNWFWEGLDNLFYHSQYYTVKFGIKNISLQLLTPGF